MADLSIADGGLQAEYIAQVTVSILNGSPTNVNVVSVPVQVQCPPSLKILGGNFQILSQTRPVKLVASFQDQLLQTPPTFRWTCADSAGLRCKSVEFIPIEDQLTQDLEFVPGLLPIGEYLMKLVVNEGTDREESDAVTVQMVAVCIPVVGVDAGNSVAGSRALHSNEDGQQLHRRSRRRR